MNNKDNLREFLNANRVISIATRSESNGLWVANVFYAVDKDFNFIFLSDPKTQHCKDIDENGEIACGIAAFNPDDLSDRVGVQIQGTAYRVKKLTEMVRTFKIYTGRYISSKGVVTVDNIKHKLVQSRPYIIKPKLIKFMNDKLYGNFGTEIFEF